MVPRLIKVVSGLIPPLRGELGDRLKLPRQLKRGKPQIWNLSASAASA
jgi:hypothetical protein